MDYKIGLEVYVKQLLLDALVLYQMCNKSLLIMDISAVGIATLITVLTTCMVFWGIARLLIECILGMKFCSEFLENTIDWSRFKNQESMLTFLYFKKRCFYKKIDSIFLWKKFDGIFFKSVWPQALWKLVQKLANSNNSLIFIQSLRTKSW